MPSRSDIICILIYFQTCNFYLITLNSQNFFLMPTDNLNDTEYRDVISSAPYLGAVVRPCVEAVCPGGCCDVIAELCSQFRDNRLTAPCPWSLQVMVSNSFASPKWAFFLPVFALKTLGTIRPNIFSSSLTTQIAHRLYLKSKVSFSFIHFFFHHTWLIQNCFLSSFDEIKKKLCQT